MEQSFFASFGSELFSVVSVSEDDLSSSRFLLSSNNYLCISSFSVPSCDSHENARATFKITKNELRIGAAHTSYLRSIRSATKPDSHIADVIVRICSEQTP